MPVSVDFETQMRGPWDTASGFLVEQWELLAAQLSPLYSQVSSLQTTSTNPLLNLPTPYPASSVLTTDATSTAKFTPTLPMPLAFTPALSITPPAITTNTDNYAPAGVQSAAILRLVVNGAFNLTGLVAPTVPHFKVLWNAGGGGTLTLKHLSTNSLAGNRIGCPGNVDFMLAPNNAIWMFYDAGGGFWQVIGARTSSGTWTPTLAPSGGSGLTVTSSGSYSRVGALCHVSFALTVTSLGSASSYTLLAGLPFAALSVAENQYLPVTWVSTVTAFSQVVWEVANGGTTGYLRYLPAGGGTDMLNPAMQVGNIAVGTVFRGSGVYRCV